MSLEIESAQILTRAREQGQEFLGLGEDSMYVVAVSAL
ncbi:MAG: hypothetical protein JWM21_388 [Acidobacteria bacterium]|nr:hypothetical protein [Acidobacteriota bacterium]